MARIVQHPTTPDRSDDLAELRSENARLIALPNQHGIALRAPDRLETPPPKTIEPSRLSTKDKVALFRRLFRGRLDVYALRWEGKSGKSGYAPACANEWKAGICEKPRIKCAECLHRQFLPVTDKVVHEHLAGKITIGVYPLLQDETCHFLAVDFDEADWREDAQAFMRSCQELQVPASLEISRSGKGAHAWVFFASAVAARDARRLGTAIISHTCIRTRQLRLTSYDRLFPNQDTMPKGGFGNLIALPLQKSHASKGSAPSWTSGFSPTRISGDTSPRRERWPPTLWNPSSPAPPAAAIRSMSGSFPTKTRPNLGDARRGYRSTCRLRCRRR